MDLSKIDQPKDRRWVGVVGWVLAVLLGLVAAYLYNRNLELASDSAAMSAKTVAMTSNITELKTQVTELENKAREAGEQAVIVPLSASEKAAKAFLAAQAKTPTDLSKYSANLVAESNMFKRFSVGVVGEGGGASVIVKNVSDNWVPIFIGQGPPPKSTGELYGMPTGWYSTEY